MKIQPDDIYEMFSTEPGTTELSARAAALELASPSPPPAPTCPFSGC